MCAGITAARFSAIFGLSIQKIVKSMLSPPKTKARGSIDPAIK
jgi:hypothetical protein